MVILVMGMLGVGVSILTVNEVEIMVIMLVNEVVVTMAGMEVYRTSFCMTVPMA